MPEKMENIPDKGNILYKKITVKNEYREFKKLKDWKDIMCCWWEGKVIKVENREVVRFRIIKLYQP